VLLFVYAAFVAASTALLIVGGGLVTSTIGVLVAVLALCLWRAEPRRWVRRLGDAALAAVVAHALLGGIANIAVIVFSLTVAIALVESPGWQRKYMTLTRTRASVAAAPPDDRLLQKLSIALVAVVYLQIVMGATMRHPNLGALAVAAFVLATAGHVFYHHGTRRELVWPSILLLVLVGTQMTLGALTVRLLPTVSVVPVLASASLLATTVVLALRTHRARFADVREDIAAATMARTLRVREASVPRFSGGRA
jgi:cytochrome c oxidase assembly protein subunit 15